MFQKLYKFKKYSTEGRCFEVYFANVLNFFFLSNYSINKELWNITLR